MPATPWRGSNLPAPTAMPAPGPAQLSRGAIALNRTHDFIDKGVSAYYYNGEDLWIWPGELTPDGYAITTVPDTTSESGLAWQATTTSIWGNGPERDADLLGRTISRRQDTVLRKSQRQRTPMSGWTAQIVDRTFRRAGRRCAR